MNELQRRVVAGAAAEMLGRGGKTLVATASGMSRNTVIKAVAEVVEGVVPSDRLRALGGGDKPLTDKQPGLLEALDDLVHPETRGTPMSLLRWTSKSSTRLAEDLVRQGFQVSSRTVLRLLHQLGYSLQANAKVVEGRQHADRDAQFRYLNDLASDFLDDSQPVISVDTKKKELVGDYANGGSEWSPAGEPERVQVHDFIDPTLGKAIPYGIYDLANNEGWVSVGDTADTAEFAVESIRRWWHQLGKDRFPDATRLLITADAGGSNGYRLRAWKVHLATLAAEIGVAITVSHYPPGTSKWNRIEHRLFSFITMNWRGRPLTSLRTIIELISATTTEAAGWVDTKLARVFNHADPDAGLRAAKDLARSLEDRWPDAAASLREGLDEMFTVRRLGVSDRLARTLTSTNPIESMISIGRSTSRNVKRWRDGKMVKRWAAAGMLNAERSFRRVKGCKDMPTLVAALARQLDVAPSCETEEVA